MTVRPVPSATGRRLAILATALGVLVLQATPALAGATDPPNGVVDQVTDAASSVVDTATDAVSDAADDAGNAASDATGGATDPVTDPVQDVVEHANDTVDDTTADAEQTVDDAARPVDEVVNEVDDATGGVIGDVTGRGDDAPGAGSGNGPRGNSNARLSPRELKPRGRVHGGRVDTAHHGGGARQPRRDGPSASTPAGVAARPLSGTVAASPSLGDRLGRAAIDAAKQLALPLGLALVVFGFVVAQHWADRKDPKLVLAPVESDYDLLTFR